MILEFPKEKTEELKGFAIFLIFLGHLGIYHHLSAAYPSAQFLTRNFFYIAAWGAGLFLFISGFGIALSFKKNGFKDYFRKRFSKVYMPFLFLTICWIFLDKYFLNKSYSIKVIFLSLAGLNLNPQIVPTMWFVPFIFIWYFAFYVIFRLPLHHKVKLCTLFFVPIIIYKFQNLIEPNSATFIHYFLFPIGVVFGFSFNIWQESIKKNKKNTTIILIFSSVILFTIVLFIAYKTRPFLGFPFDLFYFIYFSLSSFSFSNIFFSIFVFNLSVLSILFKIKIEILRILGFLSYEIYLFERAIKKYFSFESVTHNFWAKGALYFALILLLSLCYKFILRKFRDFINVKYKMKLLQ